MSVSFVVVAVGGTDGVLGLEDGVLDELAGVVVDESVEDTVACLSGGDHPGHAELGEVLGHGGGRLVDDVGQMVHGELFVSESKDHAHSGGVREHGENLDGELDESIVRVKIFLLSIFVHAKILTRRWFGV
jgi:hypothetical protein